MQNIIDTGGWKLLRVAIIRTIAHLKITPLVSYFVVVLHVLLLYTKFGTVGYTEITDARLLETIENCVYA